MSLLTSIQAPIAPHLEEYRERFVSTLQSQNPLLQSALDHVLNKRGKLVRPTLVFLCAEYADRVTPQVMDVALALELLHTASLVHDDVVDESDRRRGQASVNAFTDNKIAVLVGDFILSRALHHAANTGDARIVEGIAHLGQTLADGELLQLHNVDSDKLADGDYYSVISKKTASLFVAAARLGILAAGGSDELAERMAQFGKLVGMCFQLRDDIFDYDTNTDVGKPAANDMKEGKLTLPVIYAVTRSENEEMLRKALLVRRGESTQEDIDELIRFTIEQGGIEYAKWSMTEFRVMADGLIDDNRDSAVAKSLHRYVDFVAERSF